MVEGARLEIWFRVSLTWVRIPPPPPYNGQVTEWSKVHDWKSCVPKGTVGSNPTLSAISPTMRGGDGRVP